MTRDELQKLLLDTFGHLDDRQLLALTIFGEARGESREGKIAVGSVILERVDHRGWDGSTIKEVCLMPWQFSCFLPGDPNSAGLKLIAQNFGNQCLRYALVQQCYVIATGLLEGTIARTPEIAANHACQYCTDAVDPDWKKKMTRVAAIGHHEFYA